MVRGIDGNDNVIRLKGQNQSIDTGKLEGLKRTEKNKLIFDKYDENKDGTLSKAEADKMQAWLKQTAGNDKLSKREMRKETKDESSFEALSSLAQQQADLEEKQEYIETNKETTTHVVKKDDNITKFDSTEDDNNNVVETYEDGSKKIIHEDGSYDEVSADGNTVTSFDKEDNKTKVVKGDFTTTFENGKSKTVNKEGKVVEETETQESKEVKTTYEYQDNKTVTRRFNDNNLEFITVTEEAEGKKTETTFKTEEDMQNNKPSKKVETDSEGKTTTTEYTTRDDGNVEVKVTDPENNVTTTYQNDKGEKIDNPEQKDTYKVLKGESISVIVRKNLEAQRITNPTREQLQTARKAFLEMNSDLVKTYNGPKTEWKGNKYFYIDDVVKVPDFKKVLNTDTKDEKPEPTTPTPDAKVDADEDKAEKAKTDTKNEPETFRYTEVNTENITFRKPPEYMLINSGEEIEIEGTYSEPPRLPVTVKITVPANTPDEVVKNKLAEKIKETDIEMK